MTKRIYFLLVPLILWILVIGIVSIFLYIENDQTKITRIVECYDNDGNEIIGLVCEETSYELDYMQQVLNLFGVVFVFMILSVVMISGLCAIRFWLWEEE